MTTLLLLVDECQHWGGGFPVVEVAPFAVA
jgi:hypothetical protein